MPKQKRVRKSKLEIKHKLPKEERMFQVFGSVKGMYWKQAQDEITEHLKKYR
jgi:hypothetical protein